MKVTEYLNTVAYKVTDEDAGYECWFSKFDDSYVTHVGMEESIKHLADLEITIELSLGTGKSQKDGKWYGWSHRAIYGFEVGSECKKGDCHYIAATLDDHIEKAVNFWSGDHKIDVKASVNDRGEIWVSWIYSEDCINESIRGNLTSVMWGGGPFSESDLGRGEWTAKTESDARQMAIDFNRGVS